MAYDTRGSSGTRRSRNYTSERDQIVNRRVRGLRGVHEDVHPYRWCPEHEVTILVGPKNLCPACGELTTPG